MALYPGQKVEFIGRGNYARLPSSEERPRHGVVYTVRDVYIHESEPGVVGVRLSEIVRPRHPIYPVEKGWDATEFRPIVERKTDISIFTKMLTPDKEEV